MPPHAPPRPLELQIFTSRISWDIFSKMHLLVSPGNRHFQLPSLFSVEMFFSIKMHEILAKLCTRVYAALHACNSDNVYLILNSCLFSILYFGTEGHFVDQTVLVLWQCQAVSRRVAVHENHRTLWRKGTHHTLRDQFNTLDLGTKSIYW